MDEPGRDEIIHDKCIAKEEKKSPQVLVSLNMTMELAQESMTFKRLEFPRNHLAERSSVQHRLLVSKYISGPRKDNLKKKSFSYDHN